VAAPVRPAQAGIDVLGIGAVAVDDMLYLDHFPAPDSKGPILREERRAGGLAGTALVAARRMGRTCAYGGALGDDELSRYIIDGFRAEGIALDPLVRDPAARPFHSTILVDTTHQTRTILYNEQGVVGASAEGPEEAVIRSARALLVDHVGLAGMVRAARVARAAGVPVVADLERQAGDLFPDLLAVADHLILPFEFARTVSGAADGPAIVRALWSRDRSAVVITKSAEGSWYMTAEEPGLVYHQPAFRVREADTNGCGDVFHGVYAAGLAERMPAGPRIRFAAAVAALKATTPGGQKGIPGRDAAESFVKERAAEAPRAQA
jgi:sulfofructose kinase